MIQEGRARISSEVILAIKSTESFDKLEQRIAEIEHLFFVPPADRNRLLVRGWESSAEHFLENEILDTADEARLAEFKDYFGLSQRELDRNGAMTRTAKARVLREVLNGNVPRMSIDGSIPINYQKDEQTVWAFPNSIYLEDKTRRQYIVDSRGVGVQFMNGVYYRRDSFKGRTVEQAERMHVDTGWVVVTSKYIYFAGARKILRLPYAKIISFVPFGDGIGVMRDTAAAKLQIFVTGDGWFTYNLVVNLAQL